MTKPTTVTLRSYTYSSQTVKRMRVRQHKAGKRAVKRKTDLSVVARAHNVYEQGKVVDVVNDAAKFKRFGAETVKREHVSRKGKHYTEHEVQYTKKLLPVKELLRINSHSGDVKLQEFNTVNRLLAAILLFKGKGFEDVKQDLVKIKAKTGKNYVVYKVNTEVVYGDLMFKVGEIRVKKVFGDGIFFDTRTCKQTNIGLHAVKLLHGTYHNVL